MADRVQKAEIEKALRYLRENLASPIRARQLAAQTRYRETWFRQLFEEVTGQGIVDYVTALRIEKARELLRSTDLSVLEVGYEVGFRNLGHFTRTFRRLAGTPPGRYRRQADAATPRVGEGEVLGGEVVFRDDFRRENPEWVEGAGRWRREGGALIGESGETMVLRLQRLLPESFRVQFRLRVVPGKEGGRFAVHMGLSDSEFSARSYFIAIGEDGNSVGYLIVPHGARPWSREAVLSYRREQEIVLELDRTRLSVRLDGREVLRYREVFPARYARRCCLFFQHWRGRVEIRDFRVTDLGVPTTVPTIRLADTLYDEGMISRAQGFYVKLLGASHDPEERLEAEYKIGMTHLASGELEQAESRFRKLAELGTASFWVERARLSLLTVLARRGESDVEEQVAELRRSYPSLSDDIDQTLQNEADHLRRGGFWERARGFYEACVRGEGTPPWRRRRVLRDLVDCAMSLSRGDEALEHARSQLA